MYWQRTAQEYLEYLENRNYERGKAHISVFYYDGGAQHDNKLNIGVGGINKDNKGGRHRVIYKKMNMESERRTMLRMEKIK